MAQILRTALGMGMSLTVFLTQTDSTPLEDCHNAYQRLFLYKDVNGSAQVTLQMKDMGSGVMSSLKKTLSLHRTVIVT